MKKIFSVVLLTLVIATSLAQVKSEDLSKDENFISYTTDFNIMLDYISTTFNRSNYTALITDMDNLKGQNLSSSDELIAVAKILKYSDVTQLGTYLDNIIINLSAFRKKYGEINNDVFLESYKEVTINSSTTTSSLVAESGCRRPWRYGLCAAAVGVEGAGILAACETVTVGAGTPLCVAGALLWAANGVADCRERYCDPIPVSN